MRATHIYIKSINLSEFNYLLKSMDELLAPCRLVLHGLGLAVGVLLLTLCALLVQIGVRELLSPSQLKYNLGPDPFAPKSQYYYRPPTGPTVAPWIGADLQNQRLLAQVIANRRPLASR